MPFGRIVGETYLAHLNSKPDLVLYLRTWDGKQRFVVPAPIRPRFYVRQSDAEKVEQIISEGFGFHKLTPRSDYVRMDNWDEPMTMVEVNVPETVGKLRTQLAAGGIEAFEADIPFTKVVKRELKIHNKVKIEGDVLTPYLGDVPDMQKAYYDFENKDQERDQPEAGKDPILCVSLYFGDPKIEPIYYSTDMGENEKSVMYFFNANLLDKADVLVGWNSEDYDDKVLEGRSKFHGIDLWDTVKHAVQRFDLLKVMAFKSEKRMESHRLEHVVEEILVKEGIYPKTVERAKSYSVLAEYDPAKLEEINRSHSKAVRDLDAQLGLTDMRIAMADIAGIQVPDTYFYSRVIDSLVLRRFAEHKPRLIAPCRREASDEVKYKGAIILQPIPGQHDMVLHFDLVSLYNRVTQACNISPELWDKCRRDAYLMAANDVYVNTPNSDPKKDILLGHAMNNLIRVLASLPEGIFPQEMRKIEAWRKQLKAEKKRFEANKESLEFKRANALDRAVKTLLLAFYGQLGEARSRFYIPLMAELVTWLGRQSLIATKNELESLGLTTIYGDTDSIFAKFHGEVTFHDPKNKNCECTGCSLKNHLNEFYPKFLMDTWGFSSERAKLIEIGFEEVYDTIFFGESKKKYAGWAHEAVKPEIVGFELIRSDWCKLAKETQKKVIEMRLKKEQKESIKSYLVEVKNDLLDGKLNNKLIVSKGLMKSLKEYKARKKDVNIDREIGARQEFIKTGTKPKVQHMTLPPHVRAAEKAGIKSGRIHYVFASSPKGGTMVAEPVTDFENIPAIDMSGLVYYWKHQVFPPSERVLWGLFSEEELKSLMDCKVYERPVSQKGLF